MEQKKPIFLEEHRTDILIFGSICCAYLIGKMSGYSCAFKHITRSLKDVARSIRVMPM